MLLDWSIFIIGVTLYDFARGAARFVDAPVQVTPQADIDRIIGLGHVPTVWLQQHFLEAQPRWWDAAASIIYASHFILPFVVAGILYATNRKEWGWFASRFLVLCFLGCVTYALIPTAPPWYASQIGEIGHVVRSTGRGWQVVHVHAAATLIHKGQLVGNAYAAIPSLHAAWAALCATAVWRRVKNPARWLVYVYPAAMALTLVYTGEHYFIDAIVGWIYLALDLHGDAVPRTSVDSLAPPRDRFRRLGSVIIGRCSHGLFGSGSSCRRCTWSARTRPSTCNVTSS